MTSWYARILNYEYDNQMTNLLRKCLKHIKTAIFSC